MVASGSCFDENPGMDRVDMRILALEDDGTPIGYVTPAGAAIADLMHPELAWVGTTLTGGAYWQASLNNNENLYKVTNPGMAYDGSPLVHNGRLQIEVQPWDAGGTFGNIQSRTFTLDQTIPSLTNPTFDVDYGAGPEPKDAWDYLYVRGDITFRATASDNEFVDHLWISLDNGETWGSDLGTHAPSIVLAELIHTLTDTRIPSAIRTEKNGQVSMVVKLQDNALHFNNWNVTLNLDNRYPDKNLYTGLANGHDPMNLYGNLTSDYSQLMGTCADTGSVGGIDQVEVYLTRWNSGTEYVVDLTDGQSGRQGAGALRRSKCAPGLHHRRGLQGRHRYLERRSLQGS